MVELETFERNPGLDDFGFVLDEELERVKAPVNPTAHARTKEDITVIRHIYLDFAHNGTAAVQSLVQRRRPPRAQLPRQFLARQMASGLEVEGVQMDEARG